MQRWLSGRKEEIIILSILTYVMKKDCMIYNNQSSSTSFPSPSSLIVPSFPLSFPPSRQVPCHDQGDGGRLHLPATRDVHRRVRPTRSGGKRERDGRERRKVIKPRGVMRKQRRRSVRPHVRQRPRARRRERRQKGGNTSG